MREATGVDSTTLKVQTLVDTLSTPRLVQLALFACALVHHVSGCKETVGTLYSF